MGSHVHSRRASKRRAAEENHGRGKTVLEIDLNNAPDEIAEVSHNVHGSSNTAAISLHPPSVIVVENAPDTIDVDEIDDEVIILSESNQVNMTPLEVNQRGRTGGGNGNIDVIHIDSDSHALSSGVSFDEFANGLTLSNYPAELSLVHFLDSDSHQYLENFIPFKRMKVGSSIESEMETHLEPEEPPQHAFKCVVCLGPLVEETSTNCGHIFCLSCIKTAIKAQKKCPTCRKKLSMKSIHRVYFPGST